MGSPQETGERQTYLQRRGKEKPNINLLGSKKKKGKGCLFKVGTTWGGQGRKSWKIRK